MVLLVRSILNLHSLNMSQHAGGWLSPGVASSYFWCDTCFYMDLLYYYLQVQGPWSSSSVTNVWSCSWWVDNENRIVSLRSFFMFFLDYNLFFCNTRHVGNGCNNGWIVYSTSFISRLQVYSSSLSKIILVAFFIGMTLVEGWFFFSWQD